MTDTPDADAALLAALAPYADAQDQSPAELLNLIKQASDRAIKRAVQLAEKEARTKAAREELDAKLTALPNLMGASEVAKCFEVKRGAVSNWLIRFTGWPLPAYRGPNGYLWHDNATTREAWQTWHADKH